MTGFILSLVIGGAAGYIAEILMNVDHPWWLNVILGVAGAFLLNIVLFIVFGVSGGNILWQLLAGIIGACFLIWGYQQYKARS